MADENVKGIRIDLTLTARGVSDKLRDIRKNVRELQTDLRTLDRISKLDPSNLDTYAKKLETTQRLYERQTSLVQTYQNKLADLHNKMSSTAADIEKLSNSGDGNEKKLSDLKEKQKSYANQIEVTTKNLEKAKLSQVEYSEKVNATKKEIDDLTISQKDNSAAIQEANQNISAFDVALGELTVRAIEKTIDACKRLVSNVYDVGTSFEDAQTGLAAILQESTDSQEIQDLSSYFQDLAENSKYSADEITNNAQILANAGYNADQIKSSISTIDNLATGTGEDFTTMANVVTDGLHAFGLSADEASYFANVLAKTAISSNTNVSQLGEAFQYAGSIAGAYGYKIEDVGVALGAMASSGIKATIAGTSFRQIVTRMAAPVAESQEAMDALGLSFYDADGKARPLMDVLNELRSKLRGLSDEEKAAYEKQLAGQRGLTGLSAIINMSEEDWSNLTAEVKDYNNTVDIMSATRLDSMTGDVTKLKNEWKNTATTLYSDVEPSLRNLTRSAKNFLANDTVQKELNNVADSAANFIDKISDGLDKIDGKTLRTAKSVMKIATSIGVTTTATKKLQPVIKGVGSIFKGTSSGIIKLAGKFGGAGAEISTSSNKAVKAIKGIGSALEYVGDPTHLSLIAGVASACVAAYTALSDVADRYQEKLRDTAEAELGYTQEQKNRIKEIDENYQSLIESRQETIDTVNGTVSEYDHYDDLIKEYDSLIDANGNVKKGYEDRANVILTTLANAVGVEKQQLQDEITAQGSLSAAIGDTIDKMKAEAVAEAYKEDYVKALKDQAQVTQDLAEQQSELASAREDYNSAWDEYRQAEEDFEKRKEELGGNTTDIYGKTDEEIQKYMDDMKLAQEKISVSKDKVNELNGSVRELINTNKENNIAIENYESLITAISSGSQQEIDAAITNIQGNLLTKNNATLSELKVQYDQYNDAVKQAIDNGSSQEIISSLESLRDQAKTNYDAALGDLDSVRASIQEKASGMVSDTTTMGQAMIQAATQAHNDALDNYDQVYAQYKDDTSQEAQDAIANAQLLVDQTAAILSESQEEYGTAGETNTNAYSESVKRNQQKVIDLSKTLGSDSAEAIENIEAYNSSAKTNLGGHVSGMHKMLPKVVNAAASISSQAAGRDGLKSANTYASGANFGAGFIAGINSKDSAAYQAAYNLADQALQGVHDRGEEGSPWKTTIRSGKWLDEGFANGITDKAYLAQRAAEKLTDDTLGTFSQMPYNMASIGVDSVSKMSESMYGAKAKLSKIAQRTVNNMANSKLDMSVDYTGNSNVVGAVTALQTEVSSLQTSMNGVIDSLSNQNREFKFDIPFEINGRQFARATATYTENELNRRQKQKGRRNGNR